MTNVSRLGYQGGAYLGLVCLLGASCAAEGSPVEGTTVTPPSASVSPPPGQSSATPLSPAPSSPTTSTSTPPSPTGPAPTPPETNTSTLTTNESSQANTTSDVDSTPSAPNTEAPPSDDSAETGPQATTSGDASGETTTAPTAPPRFLLGADISSIPEALDAGATFVDTDGTTKSILELLKNHGFNAIRLRTFVNPDAEYGYARGTGGSCLKSEPYNDAAHTAEFGAAVKAAGMQLLLDFHYSDTWADPGKQIIPEAWRSANSISALAQYVSTYTTDVLEQMVAAGAKPDLVQVGNETTPGMLIHVPGAETDCWGNNSTVNNGVTGQASNGNWDNLATLFKAGADAVHAVDPAIKVVLHIENTDDPSGVQWWVNSAVSRGIDFDVLGLSAYTAFQGEPSVWQSTLTSMAEQFPDLEFIIAEYNPERTRANQIVHALPNGRGLGTFFWEPTQSGTWGESLFTQSGQRFTAKSADFAEFDALRTELGL